MLNRFNIILLLSVVLMMFSFMSCTERIDSHQQDMNINKNQMTKNLEEINRDLVKKEMELIDNYIKEHNLDMAQTGTGLRYCIEKQGDITPIKAGDVVALEYELRSLNNDMLLASSKNDGIKTFLVGRGGVEIGLEEAILYLHKGDVAEIIIPSYLAYGLIGDGYRIPPRTTLVYKVKVIENQSNK